MVVGLADILVFGGFVAAGLCYRHRPEVHKRLMLLATVGGLMWPAVFMVKTVVYLSNCLTPAIACTTNRSNTLSFVPAIFASRLRLAEVPTYRLLSPRFPSF
jgi:hypothetical protein